MEIIKYKTEYKKPCVMCLGYFDAIHLGHTKIIKTAYDLAKDKGLSLAVFLFTGGKNKGKDVFTFEERLIKLKALNVDLVVYQKLDKEFMNLTQKEFTDSLFKYYDIKYFLTGKDFTYGKDKGGNVNTLSEEIRNKKGELIIVEDVLTLNEKVSTQKIKESLIKGDISRANTLLGSNYFIRQEVVEGKKLGNKLGFPTINMRLSEDKLLMGSGVYITATIIDDKLYSCITNVGNQPTVNGKDVVIETYIKNFKGNLYGKTLSIYFVEKIREIITFDSVNELKAQLKKDLELI